MSNENNEPTIAEMLDNLPPETMKEILGFITTRLTGQPSRKSEEQPDEQFVDTSEKLEGPIGKKRKQSRRKKDDAFDIREHRKQMSEPQKRKRPAMTQSIVKHTEPNKFFKLGFDTLHKNDVEIDKKLAGNNRPTERRQQVQYINAKCTRCGQIFEVLPHEVYSDDTGIQYICDNCGGRSAE